MIFYLPLIFELIILVFVTAVYWQTNQKVKYLNREEDSVLHKARKRGRRVVEEAREEALKIIEKAKVGVVDQQILESKQIVEKFSQDIEKRAVLGVGEMDKALQDRIVLAQTDIEKEADRYKQIRLAEIDKQITQVIQSTAKKVLGRTLNLSEHGQLVSEALEEAKKQHVFETV